MADEAAAEAEGFVIDSPVMHHAPYMSELSSTYLEVFPGNTAESGSLQ